MMGRGSVTLAEQKIAGAGAPVWLYLLAWESPALDGFVKASHGMCVPLTMDNAGTVPDDRLSRRACARRADERGVDRLRAGGDPNHADLPEWAPYSLDERAVMIFDDPPRVEHDPYAAERLVWV